MSVINQMLQDLERRHAGPEDRRALPDEVRPLPAGADRGGVRRVGAWTLAIAGAGAVAWLLTAGRIELPLLGTLGAVVPSSAVPAALQGALPITTPVPAPSSEDPLASGSAVAGSVPSVDDGVAAQRAVAMRLSSDLADARPAPQPAADGRPPPAERSERSPRDGQVVRPDGPDTADRPERTRATGDRQAKRDAANAETERLVRDVVGAPAVPPAQAAARPSAAVGSAIGPSAPAALSPVMASNFAGALPSSGAVATPFVSPPAQLPVSAAPAVPVRPVDHSPPRIDRQEREPSVRERAEATYRRGVEAMHEGRMPAAEQALRDALAQFPAHEAARQTLLGILVQQRRAVDAEALLVEGQRQNPAQVGFALALARLQAERGDTPAALDSLQRSAAAGRERPEFLGFQAGLLARAGRHADAAVQYRSALRMAPQNAVWWMGLGMSLESDRRLSEAAEAFQRARETPGLNAELTAYVDQRLRSLQR